MSNLSPVLTFNKSPFEGFPADECGRLVVVVFLLCEDDVSIFNAIRLCRPIDSGNKQYHLYFDEV